MKFLKYVLSLLVIINFNNITRPFIGDSAMALLSDLYNLASYAHKNSPVSIEKALCILGAGILPTAVALNGIKTTWDNLSKVNNILEDVPSPRENWYKPHSYLKWVVNNKVLGKTLLPAIGTATIIGLSGYLLNKSLLPSVAKVVTPNIVQTVA